jgi:protoheme IX farnesyltransferase
LHALLGTGLLASGAAALNQVLERELDAKMRRTASRPLPAGEMRSDIALIFGGICAIAGMVYTAVLVNMLTALIGAITLGAYLFIYTPLKRITTFNTVIGAIPGALPPLMGWTAVQNNIDARGWSLFAILFFWQLPHFLAIAWLYRGEYEKAGFVMMPKLDPEGYRTGSQAFNHTIGLCFMSLFPVVLGLAGTFYFVAAVLLGAYFAKQAFHFSSQRNEAAARRLFLASIVYLPLLLMVMAFDKL